MWNQAVEDKQIMHVLTRKGLHMPKSKVCDHTEAARKESKMMTFPNVMGDVLQGSTRIAETIYTKCFKHAKGTEPMLQYLFQCQEFMES